MQAAVVQLNGVVVTPAGQISVATPPPTAPPGGVTVVRTAFGPVTTVSNDLYLITNTKTLKIQRLSSACEASVSGSKVELFEDQNGDLSVLNFIWGHYVNGNNYSNDLEKEYIGNGTRRILMRRTRLDGGARDILSEWVGYEV